MTNQEMLMQEYCNKLIADAINRASKLKAYYVEFLPERLPSDFYICCGLTSDEVWEVLPKFRTKGEEFVVYLSDGDLVYLTNCGAKFRLV